ncbi:MAG: DegT/DnrJ/EryC1/StrS family aminotransferase [Gammaproteobacteria bacterium]|nr:DegT/DnrJ/EryC1/StrS family aminotransferase [Gammaproteobacteria bacterium]
MNGSIRRWPVYDQEQIDAAVQVLRSGRTNYWGGSECRAFEEEFAHYHGVPHAISLANGTVALELAMIALGIGAGDEVVVPASSFVATAAAVVACGAVPVFADVDLHTGTISAATLEPELTSRTRAVIAVHLYGRPCPMESINGIAARYGLYVIEDCAQAHGARLGDRLVGSFGDVAAFSFCQDKIMSTGGEGGMLLCADHSVWARAWSHKDHGKSPNCIFAAPGTAYRWIHENSGTNWRMTEFQAAIGRVQLRHLGTWVKRRQEIAGSLLQQLAPLDAIELPATTDGAAPAWYRIALRLREEALLPGWNRDRLMAELNNLAVPCAVGVCPELYREQSLRRFAPARRCVNARALGKTSVCLIVHHLMSDEEVSWIGQCIAKVVAGIVADDPGEKCEALDIL